MATFKKLENQETHTLLCKSSAGELVLKVRDVISRVTSTGIVEKVTDAEGMENARKAGKELYIIAQSDDVTKGVGTAYKTYKLNDTVTITTEGTVVVGYLIKNLDIVEF